MFLFNIFVVGCPAAGAFGARGTVLLLSHVRRWTTDKHFFSRLQKMYAVKDVTAQALSPGQTAAGARISVGASTLDGAGSKDAQQGLQPVASRPQSLLTKGAKQLFECTPL